MRVPTPHTQKPSNALAHSVTTLRSLAVSRILSSFSQTFAIFFTMIALTSDFICYLLVPSSWLFLFGSTCVWMELVWHAERGVCAPTVAMCFLFLYVEVAVRLRDPKSVPLSIDLCRPFAAHCIGYPVVTLGFGLKSLLTHQLRLRRQHQVETHNSKYFCLLELALPEEVRTLHRRGELGNGQLAVMNSPNANSGNLAITAAPSTSTANSLPASPTSISTTSASATAANSTSTPSAPTTAKNSRKQQQQQQNLTNGKSTSVANNCDHSLASNHALSGEAPYLLKSPHCVLMYTSKADVLAVDSFSLVPSFNLVALKFSASTIAAVDRKFFGFDGGDQNPQHQNQHHHHNQHHHNHLEGEASGCCEATAVSSSCSSLSGQEVVEVRAPKKSPTATTANSSSGLAQGHSGSSSAPHNRSKASDKSSRSGKDASVYRLEDELRRLRHERQTMLVTESELRAQLAQLTTLERTSRTETNQARQEVEYLQSKLTTLTQRLEFEILKHLYNQEILQNLSFNTERENLQLAEKKAAEEKRQRNALEISLAAEKRARREAENALKASAPFGSMTNSTITTSAPSVTSSKTHIKLQINPVCFTNQDQLAFKLVQLFVWHLEKQVSSAPVRGSGPIACSTRSMSVRRNGCRVCGLGTVTSGVQRVAFEMLACLPSWVAAFRLVYDISVSR
ncbi:Macoilin [Echinococcus granulosus]|uniref:Macoilin n=1 Tax=Echinococcus granulosus TaxID=6210 RepID=W6UPU2_ECHGR|nr:Macoilin [Echinococcus granulosus]EUB55419.1 Macoilin [Echinococcus granulosus]